MPVVGGDSGIVIPGDADDATFPECGDYLVWPRRVAGEVAEVVGGADVAPVDVGEDRGERREIGVNIGDERESNHELRVGAPMRRDITIAVSGHAPRNSADALTGSGTAVLVVRVKPNFGK